MSFVTDLFRSKNDESRIQPVLADDMDYTLPLDNRPITPRRAPPRRAPPRRRSLAANQRMRMNAGDKAIEFDRIAEIYLKCENKFIEALRKSKMSIDEKLDLIVKKRDECTQSQSDIVGGRRKRRRKTRRNKKRKSRRKSRKRRRKTKRRR
tara:strand:+ start:14482 stop:14934 length:453 start_codon:yes stop_codon:yes gene_type:complete